MENTLFGPNPYLHFEKTTQTHQIHWLSLVLEVGHV